MKRTTAALVLLVILASPLQAQTSTMSTADSGGVVRTNMNGTTTTPGTTNPNDMNTTNSTTTTTNSTTNNETSTSGTNSQLPRTASPLPLLSLASFGALASSLWLSRRRRV